MAFPIAAIPTRKAENGPGLLRPQDSLEATPASEATTEAPGVPRRSKRLQESEQAGGREKQMEKTLAATLSGWFSMG